MRWRGTTDRILRISRNLFGETVTFQRPPSAPIEVRAIYNESYLLENPNRSPSDVDTRVAIVDFRAIDLPYEPLQEDLVTVDTRFGTRTFTIWRVEPDGWARYRCYLGDVP
jgi:hypothetical protein